MSKYIIPKIIHILFFLLVIILSFFCVVYFTKYDVLIGHDLVFSYGRTFLEPEHGRYIATFTNSLLTEVIPEYLNIHPNDFKPAFVSPFKGILLILICLLISFSTFIFSKKRTIFQIIFSPANTIIFLLVFLATFNNFFFFSNSYPYFAINESTVFFEYPCSFLVFIPFISLLAYYYSNHINPNKNTFYILYFLAFFTAISIDVINLPTFIFISIIGLASLIENKNKLCKYITNICLVLYILLVYFYFLLMKLIL